MRSSAGFQAVNLASQLGAQSATWREFTDTKAEITRATAAADAPCHFRLHAAFESAKEHRLRTQRGQRCRSIMPLARWAALHLTTAELGTLRAPAVVNRNGRRQPASDHG